MSTTNFNAAGSASGASQNEQGRLSDVQIDNLFESSSAAGEDGLWGSEDGEGSGEERGQVASASVPQPPPLALPTRSAPPLALPGRNVIPLPARATQTAATAVQPNPSALNPQPILDFDFGESIIADLFSGFPADYLNNPSDLPQPEQNIPDIPVPALSDSQSFAHQNDLLPNPIHDIPVVPHSQQQEQHLLDPALLTLNPTEAGPSSWSAQPRTTQSYYSYNPTAGSSNDIPVPSLSHYRQPEHVPAASSNDIPVPPLSHYQQPQYVNPADLFLNPNGPGASNWSRNPSTTYINPTPGPSYEAEAPIASTSRVPAGSETRKRTRKASETQDGPEVKKARNNQPQRDPKNPKLKRVRCPECGVEFSEKNLKRHIRSKHQGIKGKCPYCDEQLAWETDLPRHIRTKHPEKSNPDKNGTTSSGGPPAPRGPPPPPPPGGSGIAAF